MSPKPEREISHPHILRRVEYLCLIKRVLRSESAFKDAKHPLTSHLQYFLVVARHPFESRRCRSSSSLGGGTGEAFNYHISFQHRNRAWMIDVRYVLHVDQVRAFVFDQRRILNTYIPVQHCSLAFHAHSNVESLVCFRA